MTWKKIHFPLEDRQQDPHTYCDGCGGEIYGEINCDGFGAILCDECKEELDDESTHFG